MEQSRGFSCTWDPSVEPVAGELATLFNRLDSGQIATGAFQPLVLAVTQKASDVEIWKHVFLLIASASRIKPPPSVDASFGATPTTYSSASHKGSKQTERLLYDALRDELRGCACVKVQGFFERYFEGRSWSQKGKEIYESVKHMHSAIAGRHFQTYPLRALCGHCGCAYRTSNAIFAKLGNWCCRCSTSEEDSFQMSPSLSIGKLQGHLRLGAVHPQSFGVSKSTGSSIISRCIHLIRR